MTTSPASFRRELAAGRSRLRRSSSTRAAKASDGTVKALFPTRGGHPVRRAFCANRDGRAVASVCRRSRAARSPAPSAPLAYSLRPQPDAAEILDQALPFRRSKLSTMRSSWDGRSDAEFDSVLEAARSLPYVCTHVRPHHDLSVGRLPGSRASSTRSMSDQLSLSLPAANRLVCASSDALDRGVTPLTAVLSGSGERTPKLRRRIGVVEYV